MRDRKRLEAPSPYTLVARRLVAALKEWAGRSSSVKGSCHRPTLGAKTRAFAGDTSDRLVLPAFGGLGHPDVDLRGICDSAE